MEPGSKTYRWINIARLVASAAAGLIAYFAVDAPTLAFLIGVHFLFSAGWVLASESGRIAEDRGPALFVPPPLDIGLNTALLLLAGNVHSYFLAGYFLIAMLAAMHPRALYAAYTGVLAVAGYLVAGLGVYLGWLPNRNVLAAENPEPTLAALGLSAFFLSLSVALAIRIVRGFVRRNAELLLHAERLRGAAEASSRIKSSFLANMNHELRTPLAGIIGVLELLRDTSLNAEQRDYVAILKSSSETLRRIVHDILDISRMESGQLALNQERCSLPQLIEDVYGMLHAEIVRKELDWRLNIGADAPEYFYGDSLRIRQILGNLLSNAVKYTPPGGSVELSARLEDCTGSDCMLALTVRDTGEGMTPEKLRDVFEPFRRLEEAEVAHEHPGAGLGLALTMRLARMMGGDLSARSVPGEGSEFCATLRVRPANEATPAEFAPSPPAGAAKQTTVASAEAPRRILIVDDNSANRMLLARLMELRGYVVDQAEDGRAAVEAVAAAQFRYALILMDVQMPRLDGVEAAREIQMALGSQAPPVIAVTANAYEENRRRCLAAGMQDFIAKPFHRERLYESVERVLLDHDSAPSSNS